MMLRDLLKDKRKVGRERRAAGGFTASPRASRLSRIRGVLDKVSQTAAYDAAMRFVTVAAYSLLAGREFNGFLVFIGTPHPDIPQLLFVTRVLARIAVLTFLGLFVVLTLLRRRPVAKARGIGPRVAAILGAFLILGIVLFPRLELPVSLNVLSAFLIFIGEAAGVYIVVHLGRSFSLMAEARRLVSHGPYAIIRHPLYLAEEVSILGVFIQYASVPTALLLLVHFAIQLTRMRNEERVLLEAFPEYRAYMERTARLIPGIY